MNETLPIETSRGCSYIDSSNKLFWWLAWSDHSQSLLIF